jgi:membrane fusion protein (multidrug efflux system)
LTEKAVQGKPLALLLHSSSLLTVPFRALFFSCFRETILVLLAAVALGSISAGCKRGADPKTASTAAEKSGAAKAPPSGGPTADQKAAAQKATAEKDRARLAAAEAVPVETALIARGPISAFLAYNSTLETEAIVDIYPQTSGQVEAVLVEEGVVVKAGDPLLQIEDRELRVDFAESSMNYLHQQQGFARIEDLFKRNMINKQEYDNTRYQLEQARLRDERAKLRLSYSTVRAPFDGVVASRDTQVGARVGTGTKLFSLVKLDDIVARVFVPGRYLSVVALDQPAVVTSEFLPDRTFKGWVKRISPVIDPKSGTFKVTIGVKGEKPTDLPPGLFVGVRILTDTKPSAMLVPKRAVVYEGGERYVFTVANGKASKRKLVAGFEDNVNVEALSGLEVGTPVIVLGHSGLKDGAMVRNVNEAPSPSPSPITPASPPGKPGEGSDSKKEKSVTTSVVPKASEKAAN